MSEHVANIVSGIGVLAFIPVWIFAVFAALQFFLRSALDHNRSWWAFPAYMATMVPMAIIGVGGMIGLGFFGVSLLVQGS